MQPVTADLGTGHKTKKLIIQLDYILTSQLIVVLISYLKYILLFLHIYMAS